MGRITSKIFTDNKFIQLFTDIKKTSEYATFIATMLVVPRSIERMHAWRTRMVLVYSDEKGEAIYCKPENTIKFQSCQIKVLQSIALENNGMNYDAYVRQLEDHYHIYIQQLHGAFPDLHS